MGNQWGYLILILIVHTTSTVHNMPKLNLQSKSPLYHKNLCCFGECQKRTASKFAKFQFHHIRTFAGCGGTLGLQQISHQRHQNSVADLHRFHQVIFSSLISIVGETEEKRRAVSGNLVPSAVISMFPLLSFPLVLRASCTNLFFILHLSSPPSQNSSKQKRP